MAQKGSSAVECVTVLHQQTIFIGEPYTHSTNLQQRESTNIYSNRCKLLH